MKKTCKDKIMRYSTKREKREEEKERYISIQSGIGGRAKDKGTCGRVESAGADTIPPL